MSNAKLTSIGGLLATAGTAWGVNKAYDLGGESLSNKIMENIIDKDSPEFVLDNRAKKLNSLSKLNLPLYKSHTYPNAAFYVDNKTGEMGLLFGRHKGKPLHSRETVAHELGHAKNYLDPKSSWRIKTSGLRDKLGSHTPWITYTLARMKGLGAKKSLLTALGVGTLAKGFDNLVTLREEGEASRKGLDLLKQYNKRYLLDRVNTKDAEDSLNRAYNTYLYSTLATPFTVGASVLGTHSLFELVRKAKKLIRGK